jgi:uncharacterized protein (TIGR03067 family)
MAPVFFISLLTFISSPCTLPAADEREELAQLYGTWVVQRADENGMRWPKEKEQGARLIIPGARFRLENCFGSVEGALTLDPSSKGNAFDAVLEFSRDETVAVVGIYKIEGDTLTVCFSKSKTRPTEFASLLGESTTLIVAKRKPEEKLPH